LTTWRARLITKESGGTFSVTLVPVATKLPAPTVTGESAWEAPPLKN
jgi:hypothetical protein